MNVIASIAGGMIGGLLMLAISARRHARQQRDAELGQLNLSTSTSTRLLQTEID